MDEAKSYLFSSTGELLLQITQPEHGLATIFTTRPSDLDGKRYKDLESAQAAVDRWLTPERRTAWDVQEVEA